MKKENLLLKLNICTSNNSLCLAWLFESKSEKLGKRGVEQGRGDQVQRLKISYRLWDWNSFPVKHAMTKGENWKFGENCYMPWNQCGRFSFLVRLFWDCLVVFVLRISTEMSETEEMWYECFCPLVLGKNILICLYASRFWISCVKISS